MTSLLLKLILHLLILLKSLLIMKPQLLNGLILQLQLHGQLANLATKLLLIGQYLVSLLQTLILLGPQLVQLSLCISQLALQFLYPHLQIVVGCGLAGYLVMTAFDFGLGTLEARCQLGIGIP